MAEVDYPDRHHLSAALGWLELGNAREARAELNRIAPRQLAHPDVLEMRWKICAAEKRWDEALIVARAVIDLAPERPSGWIHQSYSLHELKRTREAWTELLRVAGKFTDVSMIPYNLACYACQLGNLTQAQRWLAAAISIAGKEEIKSAALADADLRPIWPEVEKL